MVNISSKNSGWVTLAATVSIPDLYSSQPTFTIKCCSDHFLVSRALMAQVMIMFVVIKQSLFDQKLSDTKSVQVPCLVVLVELLIKKKMNLWKYVPRTLPTVGPRPG